MKHYSLEDGKYPDKNQTASEEFFGDGWSVKKNDNVFILSYVSGELQGKFKEVEISEDDYNLLITDKKKYYDVCLKYGIS